MMKSLGKLLGLLTFAVLLSCSGRKEKITYYQDGTVEAKMQVVNGKLDGESYYYSSDGVLLKKTLWKDGIRDGISESYYPSGKLRSKVSWRNGSQNGVAEFYHPNGKLQSKDVFKDGKQNGLSLEYYANGQLRKRAYKKYGKIVGEITIFNEAGKPVETRIYDQSGNMIYVAGYNKEGIKDSSYLIPIFRDENDTITVGEIYKTSVSFPYKLKGDINMLVGTFDKMNGMIDTFAVLKPTESGEFNYSIRATKPGPNSISVKFIHKTDEKDTLSLDNIVLKHSYYVK